MFTVTTSSDLQAVPLRIAGAMKIVPKAWPDERGFFKESYVRSKYQALGILDNFVQDSTSYSAKNVLRGLHGDQRMSKLVHVLRGEVFDVIVDARRQSPTFGCWEAVHLSEVNHAQIYIPAGCLHGFLTLSDGVLFYYKQSAEYCPATEFGVRWDDSALAIKWPDLGSAPTVSAKDQTHGSFAETCAT